MAMTQAGLSTAIKTELESQFGAPIVAIYLQKFADGMAKAIVEYIQNNADIALQAGDISVPALGILDGETPTPQPCTGTAQISAVTLATRIK